MNKINKFLPLGKGHGRGGRGGLCLVLIGLSFLFLHPERAAKALSFDPKDLQRLEKGGVAVRNDQGDEQREGRVQAAILVEAPADQIWKVMNDCEHCAEFIPGLKSCRVLRREGKDEIIEHRMKFSWLLPEVTYVFRAQYEKNRQVSFQRIAGNLKKFEGNWTLYDIDEGRKTIVVYSLCLDPGFLIPQWMVRLLLQEDLPAVLCSLRERTLAMPRKEPANK